MTSRQLCVFYFTDLGKGLFECQSCGRHRKKTPGSGYSKLNSHLNSKHVGFAEEYAELHAAGTPSLTAFGFVDEVSRNIYQWMEWISARNLPITEVENKITRAVVITNPTTVKTLKQHMRHVALSIEKNYRYRDGDIVLPYVRRLDQQLAPFSWNLRCLHTGW